MLTLVKDDLSVQQDSPPPQRDYNRRRFLAWLRDEVAILRSTPLYADGAAAPAAAGAAAPATAATAPR